MKTFGWVIAAVGVLIGGCATIIAVPTSLDSERSGVPLETLVEGRQLFVGRCGSCHRTPDPGSLNADEWGKVLPEMMEDAKLSPPEAAQVLAFLQALARPSGSLPDAHAERR